MAYVPDHKADVFISYAREDYPWVEKFKAELNRALCSKLRANIAPEIFFDTETIRAGRVFDKDIPDSLAATGFLLAMVSRRYNASTYCIQKELAYFLRLHELTSGRAIQAHLDNSVPLPLPKALAVAFSGEGGAFDLSSQEFKDSLRRVYEPVVSELDRLFAQSKLTFLAFPADSELQAERDRLRLEIEGRGLRVYPEEIGDYADDVRLRDAFAESSTSVHFFAGERDVFAERQLRIAAQLGKPLIIVSTEKAETRQGPTASPPPIWLGHGNPTTATADALDKLLGRGKREEKDLGVKLGKSRLLLVYEAQVDYTLGLSLRQRIVNRGPFEVFGLEPEPQQRYRSLSSVKAALLCRAKAEPTWLESELDQLNRAMEQASVFDLKRAIYEKSPRVGENLQLLNQDRVLKSDEELDRFLVEVRGEATSALQ